MNCILTYRHAMSTLWGQDCGRFFPPGLFDDGRPGRGRAAWPPGWPALSGKFAVLAAMLERLRPTGERIVIVSNYTQTLDLFSQLCRERGVRFFFFLACKHCCPSLLYSIFIAVL